MSAKKEDLFDLIQSLSKAEKRYFKIEARKGGTKSSNYLKLFDAINKMEEYDEDWLKKQSFVKHLSAEKAYLYDAMLRSLRNFRSEKSSSAQLSELMLDARYLYARGLYDQSHRLMQKAKKLAYSLQNHTAALEINTFASYFILARKGAQNAEQLEALIKERKTLAKIIQEEIELSCVADKISLYSHESYHAFKDDLVAQNINEVVSPYLKGRMTESDFSSAFAYRSYLHTMANYHRMNQKNDSSNQFTVDLIDFWESIPKIRNEEFHRYLSAIYNLIQKNLLFENYELLTSLLVKLEDAVVQNKTYEGVVFALVSHTRLVYYMNTDQFDKAILLADKIKKGLENYTVINRRRIVLSINVAILFFVQGRYKDSKEWLEFIIKKPKLKDRRDLQNIARIIYCIIHLEEERYFDAIESVFRSTSRYFKMHATHSNDDCCWR